MYGYFAIALVCASWIILIVRYVKDKYGPVKVVKAVVKEKYKYRDVSMSQLNNKNYIVVFLAGEKSFRLGFQNFLIRAIESGKEAL